MTKRIAKEWLKPDKDRNYEILREAFSSCMLSDGFKEGALAFIEKRKPSFSF